MADIYETKILCNNCNKETSKDYIIRDGFKIRVWECKQCGRIWEHPGDKQNYDNFAKMKGKTYRVKLRLVGNSYTVSIPREIIEFEREMIKEFEKMDRLIRMSLEEPEKLSLFFYDED